MHKVEAALHREPNGLAMHGSIAEIEAAAIAMEAHLQFVECHHIGVDFLAFLRVDRRSPLDDKPAQSGFVAQDKIIDHKHASERIRREAHTNHKTTALHMFVKVEERQK